MLLKRFDIIAIVHTVSRRHIRILCQMNDTDFTSTCSEMVFTLFLFNFEETMIEINVKYGNEIEKFENGECFVLCQF